MSPSDNEFLKRFYQALHDRPLDPVDDATLYVPLYAERSSSPTDPVDELLATIEWSPVQSAQLFSGFRGTGKSTELRRLKRGLERLGCVVVLCDMKDYVNMSTPVDVSDFFCSPGTRAFMGDGADPVDRESVTGRGGNDALLAFLDVRGGSHGYLD